MPSASSGAACDGRPPAMSATGGRSSRTTASCSSRSSGGTKPRMPTPHGRSSPTEAAVSASRVRISSPRMSERARNGSAPPSATAAANPLRSLTRVIGPWAIGRHVPRVAAVPAPGASGRSSRAAAMWSAIDAPQGADDAARGLVAVGERAGERPVLTDREELGAQVVGTQAGRDVVGRGVGAGEGQVGAGEHPVAADHDGLAAVHGPDGRADVARQRGVSGQRQLGVEHHAARPSRDGGGRGVEPDAALEPDRGVDGRHEALQEHEGRLLADPPARLGPLRHQPVGAGVERRPRLDQRGDLGEDATAGGPVRARPARRPRRRPCRPHRGGRRARSRSRHASRTPNGPSWRDTTRAISVWARTGSRPASSTPSAPARHSATTRRPSGRAPGVTPMISSRSGWSGPDVTIPPHGSGWLSEVAATPSSPWCRAGP